MDYTIRRARPGDRKAIASFTQDTFSWGDYVADRFDDWRTNPKGILLVATDDNDAAIGLGFGALLSPSELWLQGGRVHPGWRRRGIGSALDLAMEDWARERGAKVVRLAIEDWNEPAQRQVEKIGMHRVGTWVSAGRQVTAGAPVVSGNGGRRRPPQDRLAAAPSAEATPAFMEWSGGELGRAARGLLAIGWTWRRLTPEDLMAAAKASALWMSPDGWILGAADGDRFEVGWLETAPDGAAELVKASLDLASEMNASRLSIKVPSLPWLEACLEKAGFEIDRVFLYAKAL